MSHAQGLQHLQQLAELPGYKRAAAFARLTLIEKGEEYATAKGGPRRFALAEFCEKYSAGLVDVDQPIREQIASINIATWYRWESALNKGGVAGLAPNYGNRANTGKVERSTELQNYLLGVVYEHPHIRARRAVELIRAARPDLAEGLTERIVQKWLRDWKEQNAQLFTYVSNPDQWKSRFKAAFGTAAEDVVRLNQLWELDSTPADVMLLDGRHSVLGCIDVYSRRLKLLVSKTSKATAVAALMRRCLLSWGVPESVRTDQGKDYTSNHLRGVFRSLGVEHKLCAPFASEQKPFIERSFRTFSHGLLELRKDFIGHNVAEQQRIRSRASFAERLFEKDTALEVKMSAADFQAFCDDWCTSIYERAPHNGLDGATPFDRVTGWTGELRQIDPSAERALDVLLAEAPDSNGIRTVTKKGISVDRVLFQSPELGALIGQRVQVRLDATDMGRIFVYDEDGQFLCIAVAPHLSGLSHAEGAKAVQKSQREAMNAGRAEMKAHGKAVKESLRNGSAVETILAAKRAELGNVMAFPRPAVEHTTPALEQAAIAADTLATMPKPAEVASLDQARKAISEADEDRAWKDQQWNRYKALKARPESDVESSDLEWLRLFEGTPLYRSRMLFEGADMTVAPARRR